MINLEHSTMEVTLKDDSYADENDDEELEEEMIPCIPTEDLSPYQYLDEHLVIILTSGTNTPKCDISKEVEKHDAKEELQETPDTKIFTPVNLNIHEQFYQ